MQQPKPLKPSEATRQVRLERRPKSEMYLEENLSWAISYSDMLMVLMSFFIIFFSMNDKEANSLEKIALQIKAGGKNLPTNELVVHPQKKLIPATEPNATLESISIDIKNLRQIKQVTNLNGFLLVDLPDGLYPQRSFDVNGAVGKNLNDILKVLKKYETAIIVTFIGHADNTAINNKNRFLTNNFDLSSLRASRAMSYAMDHGFAGQRLAVEGRASNMRNTRSLSIKVELFTP